MADAGEAGFAYKPLYVQVRDSLVRRLIEGRWQPGQLIPSEIELAREVGVSQGTIRKALDAMTAENLLVRRQGRGTYVAEPEDGRMLFQFFRLTPDRGERAFPTSQVSDLSRSRANKAEREALELEDGSEVWRISRSRALEARPLISESITLPLIRFPDFDRLEAVPNNVYLLYSQRWRVTIARAVEKLKAVTASPDDAAALGCNKGAPLLEIKRIALDLEGRPVELRVSRCLTDHVHYLSELR
ncbi:MAG: GntR family transcriptional regulator [Rhizobiaceae bacterium]|nr:GntR family transcriptional regulator [Rhizobiaceae bacterium]MCV0408787.1 GntR family transcriptional regulator [Rhizobiaceae bacterium]